MTVLLDTFQQRSSHALHDARLQASLRGLSTGFVVRRADAVAAFADFEELRRQGQAIKDHALEHLDRYLLEFEANVQRAGGKVHWARDAAEARNIIRDLCRKANARTVTKGKSMVSEEIALNEALLADGLEVIETDAGEYIVQLAGEAPSHIVMPTVHKTTEQISDLFFEHHKRYGFHKRETDAAKLIAQVRTVMRDKYFAADVGITGANFLIAETGSIVLVTNEGNGDLTSTLARTHIVTVGIEKVVPTLDDASTLLRLLARSALGMDITSYTSFITGPKRPGDIDGPEAFHVVLIDNGRTKMLSGAYRSMLRCIRCGACMNHCPVYMSVGGHSYGWVYPGPMGAVLTPMIDGHETAKDLPHACTLNGKCQQVCPVKIPLPDLLRRLRHAQWEAHFISKTARFGISTWALLAKRPRLYHAMTSLIMPVLARCGRGKGAFKWLPLASGWTASRDLPSPEGRTFQAQWKRRQR